MEEAPPKRVRLQSKNGGSRQPLATYPKTFKNKPENFEGLLADSPWLHIDLLEAQATTIPTGINTASQEWRSEDVRTGIPRVD